MKKIVFIILLLTCNCYAQLPNQNTFLIAQLDNYSGYSGLWGYVDANQREYAILGCDSGTSFIDISDTANVREIDYVPGIYSGWREIKTYSHYAYVVSEGTNSRLQIIDLQYLPDSVSLINTWNYTGYTQTHAISQSGPYLYLSGGNAAPNGGVQIVDVSEPVNPLRRGFNAARYVHDCRVLSDTIWACNINNQRVSIINANDKDNLQEIRSFTTLEAMPHNCAITKDRKYIFVTHENQDPGKIEIFDISDLENITYVRSWQPTGIFTSVVHNIEIYDTIAIAAHYTAGVRFINISNPANPVEIAWYDTRPQDNLNTYQGCWAVYKFPSGKVAASDISNGLFVIGTSIFVGQNNFTQVSKDFRLYQNYPNPFNPTTSISFDLKSKSHVRLTISDVLGNEVMTLLDKTQQPGSYNIKVNGSELSSGIYFYKLETENYSQVMKMILVK